MADPATSELARVLAFESTLDEQVCDEVRRETWGSAFLTPSLPLVWDVSWVELEQTGIPLADVVAIADEVLGSAGFAHRTVAMLSEADGRRLAAELEADPARWPGWEAERTRYMVLSEDAEPGRPSGVAARERRLAQIEPLRRALIGEELKSAVRRDEVIDQLSELGRRAAVAAGDRWFVAPADGDPASACRLFQRDGIAQIDDVGTRLDSRERGYGKAVVNAAIAAARADGDEPIFLVADAEDWPQLMYAKLGFEAAGDVTILRRRP